MFFTFEKNGKKFRAGIRTHRERFEKFMTMANELMMMEMKIAFETFELKVGEEIRKKCRTPLDELRSENEVRFGFRN